LISSPEVLIKISYFAFTLTRGLLTKYEDSVHTALDVMDGVVKYVGCTKNS
jgi:hypothetical protein